MPSTLTTVFSAAQAKSRLATLLTPSFCAQHLAEVMRFADVGSASPNETVRQTVAERLCALVVSAEGEACLQSRSSVAPLVAMCGKLVADESLGVAMPAARAIAFMWANASKFGEMTTQKDVLFVAPFQCATLLRILDAAKGSRAALAYLTAELPLLVLFVVKQLVDLATGPFPIRMFCLS